MIGRIAALIFCVLRVAAAYGQRDEASGNFIEWNPYYELQWHDFEGKPGDDAIGDAGTVVRIKAKPYRVKKEIRYDVVALFRKDKSWTRAQSDALLAHEQLHFDIAELYARKIRKRLEQLSREGVNDVATYNAAVRALLEESNETDRRYDIETLHGALVKKQRAWQQQVKADLQALEKFRKHKRVITAG